MTSVAATNAANDIRTLTQDNGTFGTSRNGQMHQAREILSGLSPADRNAAIGQLSNDDLRALSEDVNASGIFGAQGLSRDEQRDLFNTMAQGLDGAQLARVSAAFDSRENVTALGEAIATHSTAQTKVDFVRETAARTTDNPTTHHTGFSSYSEVGDADAVAIGTVVASLRGNGPAVDQSLAALSDEQLQAVTTAGAGQVNHYHQGGVSIGHDTAGITGFLDAAATATSAEQKGRAFEAGANTLDEIGKNGTSLGLTNVGLSGHQEAIQASLTRVIDADTNGVLRHLETADRTGGALSAYVTQTLSQEGGQDKIGELVSRVQQGNGLNEAPNARMEALEGGHYRNAQVMGYLSGAIQVGITKNAESAKEQAEMLTGIFSKVIGLGTGRLPEPLSTAAGMLTDEVMKQIVKDASSSGDLSSAMYALTFPTDARTNRPYEGPAEADYDSASSRVILANR